jgi:hypothetical protein
MSSHEYGIEVANISSSADPYTDAATFTGNTSIFVERQIDNISGAVFGAGGGAGGVLEQTTTIIDTLGELSAAIASLPDYDVPDAILEPEVTVEFDIPDIDTTVFGQVDNFDVTNTINTSGLPSIGAVTVPGFDPTPFSIVIPPAPVPILLTEPGDGPATPTFTYPDDIVITLPDSPQLTPIVIPAFTSPVIATFAPDFPVFSEQEIDTLINWVEPVYTEEVIDEVKTQISVFFAGGSGIDPDVEESIFARGRDREDRTVRQSVQQATAEWAGKGYTAPPGMLVKRIDNIREEGTLKKLGLNREQTIKVFDAELENLRFAVQQGIAAEQLYVQLFLSKVERLFESQKLSIQWQIDLYNVAVQAFQIQMQGVAIRTQVYQAQVQASLIEIEVFKALIEGEKVKADINKVLVDAYVAEIGSREALVRMYGEQVKAVGIRADVFGTEVEAYKGEVEAYAARIGADKNRFDAFASQIRGEAVKADIREAEARAYQAEIGGIEVGVRAEVAALEGEVSGIEAQIRNYEAIVRGQVGRAQTQVDAIQANVAGNSTNTERFVAKTGAEEAASKVELAAWEGTNRTNLEIFKTNMASFQARLERQVKEIELSISTQSASGQLASTIAAGGMAAMHVGASISGGGSVGSSGNLSYTNSTGQTVACNTNNCAY